MKKILKPLGAVLAVACACVAAVNAQPGPVYEITQGLTSSGGGTAGELVTSREITGTIAQPVAGTLSNAGAFGVWGGFWTTAVGIRTSSGVSVSGRVTSGGRGVTNASVTITDRAGVTRSAVTGRMGAYRLEDVVPGDVYVISVVARRFSFAPRVVTVTDDLAGVDFASP